MQLNTKKYNTNQIECWNIKTVEFRDSKVLDSKYKNFFELKLVWEE